MRQIPVPLLIRDLLLVAVTLGLWGWTRQLGDGGALAVAVAIGAGVMTAVSGYLFHEWGHLVGARAAHAVVELPSTPAAVFLFKFDVVRNSRRQFLWMSMGGFIASGIIVAFLLAVLSFDRLADQVAIGLTAAGVLATFILEFPPAWRVWRGGDLPTGVAFVGTSTTDR